MLIIPKSKFDFTIKEINTLKYGLYIFNKNEIKWHDFWIPEFKIGQIVSHFNQPVKIRFITNAGYLITYINNYGQVINEEVDSKHNMLSDLRHIYDGL